jgi:hypothetical protein
MGGIYRDSSYRSGHSFAGKAVGKVAEGRAGQVLVNCRICGSKAREQATIDGLVIRCPWADCPQHTNTMCILGWDAAEWNRLNGGNDGNTK